MRYSQKASKIREFLAQAASEDKSREETGNLLKTKD
jgi:hypothetical protein